MGLIFLIDAMLLCLNEITCSMRYENLLRCVLIRNIYVKKVQQFLARDITKSDIS
jgi:hypothetical protein